MKTSQAISTSLSVTYSDLMKTLNSLRESVLEAAWVSNTERVGKDMERVHRFLSFVSTLKEHGIITDQEEASILEEALEIYPQIIELLEEAA